MLYQLKPYWDAILAERTSSWALITVLYMLAGLFVRSWFIGPLFTAMKQLEKGFKKDLKRNYFKKSLPGWIFFLLPSGFFAFLWKNDALPFVIDQNIIIIAAIAAYVFSILLHLMAFGIAAVTTLKKTSDAQEKKLFEA